MYVSVCNINQTLISSAKEYHREHKLANANLALTHKTMARSHYSTVTICD